MLLRMTRGSSLLGPRFDPVRLLGSVMTISRNSSPELREAAARFRRARNDIDQLLKCAQRAQQLETSGGLRSIGKLSVLLAAVLPTDLAEFLALARAVKVSPVVLEGLRDGRTDPLSAPAMSVALLLHAIVPDPEIRRRLVDAQHRECARSASVTRINRMPKIASWARLDAALARLALDDPDAGQLGGSPQERGRSIPDSKTSTPRHTPPASPSCNLVG